MCKRERLSGCANENGRSELGGGGWLFCKGKSGSIKGRAINRSPSRFIRQPHSSKETGNGFHPKIASSYGTRAVNVRVFLIPANVPSLFLLPRIIQENAVVGY